MSNRAAGRVGRAIAAITIALGATSLVLGVITRTGPVIPWAIGIAAGALALAGFSWTGALLVSRKPRSAIGWICSTLGLTLAVAFAGNGYAAYAGGHGPVPGAALGAWAENTVFPAALFLVAFLILLFPDGRLPSPRWRLAARVFAASGIGWVIAFAFAPGPLDAAPSEMNPLGLGGPVGDVLNVAHFTGWFLVAVTVLSATTAVVRRLLRARGDEREQLRWLATVGALFALLFLASTIGGFNSTLSTTLGDIAAFVAAFLPVAIAIAVFKYRLYDIDLVISRTVVYGALAIFISAVYVGLVVGIGSIVGRGTRANLVLSLAATAIVALAFQPARARLQRAANRLVYGKQATPYEVLSEFNQRVAEAYASEELLPRMARVLGEGTGAQRAGVWLQIEDQLRRVAEWPDDGSSPPPVVLIGSALPPLDAGRTVAVRHGGELLGALTISKRAGEALTPIEEKLLNDLATQAGLVLKNAGLNQELLLRLQELRASRQRLVTAQDEERRRLERNLHDGAQQQLVALKIRLGLVEALTVKDPLRAQATIAELKADTDAALDNLRDLARGIYPPLLADRGLTEAIRAQARKITLSVKVDADGIGRYSEDIEAAIYFCCLEALQNVQKYSGASGATVSLHEADGRLYLRVHDSGTGFDPGLTPKGAGLQNMKDRLDALGGKLTVQSSVGTGTSLLAELPVTEPALPTSREP